MLVARSDSERRPRHYGSLPRDDCGATTTTRAGLFGERVDDEQPRGLCPIIRAAVARPGREQEGLAGTHDQRWALVVERVRDGPAEHVAAVRRVAPFLTAGTRRVLHERPASAVDVGLAVAYPWVVRDGRARRQGDRPWIGHAAII